MKKKNVLVICAAAGFCMICVVLLLGSMGIYAEKSGTAEFEPEFTDSEETDMLTKVLADSSESEEVITEGPLQAEELRNIRDTMYAKYDVSEQGQERNAQQQEEAEFLGSAEQTGELSDYGVTLDSVKLGVLAAGSILLKEINRLYPEESFESFEIEDLSLEKSIGMNGQPYISWRGMLQNQFEANDKNYISYQFEIDAVTGKIIQFSKFRPYQSDVDYSEISWTDEEILARAKELIEMYGLTAGEELDWSNVELYNGTKEVASLKEELAEEPDLSVSLANTVIFSKNGKRYFYIGMDFETGELSTYLWPGTCTSQEILSK